MPTTILAVFATETEAAPFMGLTGAGIGRKPVNIGSCEIEVLITGVGSISMAWSLMERLGDNSVKPSLAINAGIAGTFNPDINVGDVVIPVSDCFADLGIEYEDGFKKLTDTNLMNSGSFPFSEGFIVAGNSFTDRIPEKFKRVTAVSVNTVSGSPGSVEKLKRIYNPDIETMEGATFSYICARKNIPFLAVKAVSNIVEPGRKSWDIPLAAANLAGGLKEIILKLC